MSTFILMKKQAGGRIIEYPVDSVFTIQAEADASYWVVERDGGEVPEDLLLRREGDMLVIEIDDAVVARIDDFYSDDMTAVYIPYGPSGAADDVLISGGEVAGVADGAEVWAASDDGSGSKGWFLGGAGALALGGILAVAAGGDSDSSDDGGGSHGSDDDGGSPDAAGYTVTVEAVAGKFVSEAQVAVYDKDGNLLTQGAIDPATGQVSFTITNGYSGPILVVVSDGNGDDGDYMDEATDNLTDMDSALRAMAFADGASDITLTVSPLTELAVRQAGIDEADLSLTEADVTVNDQIGALFGVADITGSVTTVLDPVYDESDGIDPAEHYGQVLAMLSGADSNTGGIDETLDQLEASLAVNESGSLELTESGEALLEQGADSFEDGDNGGDVDLGDMNDLLPGDQDTVDEVPPVFTSGTMAATIDENSSAGQTVYTAAATDASAVTYNLKGTGDDSLFSIDGGTGDVTLTGNPDYENKSGYSFTVVATDGAGNSSEQAVSLGINNLDEEAPAITSAATATAIDENSGSGQVVYTVTSDDTADISGGVTYSLKGTGDDSLFSINGSTGDVTLTGNPDYENKSSYSFTVVATDDAGNSSEQAVSLAINNLDEDAPVFTSGASAAAIDENSGAGQMVYAAAVTDASAVTYSLKGTGDDSLFSIDGGTGDVILTGNPDYENKSSYSFTVVATDGAGNSSEQVVSLVVNDLDDDIPVFTSGASAMAIDENSGAGQAVYAAAVTDASAVTYSLKGTGDDSLFSIDGGTGDVTLTGNPDYENKSSYSFTVVATDGAGNSSEQAVSLGINNLDEEAPTITSAATATAIDENSGSGQVVYTVTSDDTADISGGVTYSLKGTGDDNLFSIDGGTGDVILTGNPDYESQSSYSFTAVATDGAGNSSEQTVSLAISDQTDEAPPVISAVSIPDTAMNVGDIVTVTITVDADTDTYTNLQGTIGGFALSNLSKTSDTTYTAKLAITEGGPDVAAASDIPVNVTIDDSAGNTSAAFTTVISQARDSIDANSPVFMSGASAAAIDENSGAGQTVYTAEAMDALGVTYSLKGTGDDSLFSINGSTGDVTLTGNPDYESKSSYLFTVVATDSAGNSSEQTVSLAISNQTDETPPVISAVSIPDTTMNVGDTVIVTITVDADTDTYTNLQGTIGGFALSNLSKTSDTTYTAEFTVTEGGTDVTAASDIPVNITIDDSAGNTSTAFTTAISQAGDSIDANSPVFTSGTTAVAIDENSGAGQTVYSAAATDVSAVTYSLKGTGDDSLFSIDGGTGDVILTGNPDYENKSSYSFTVVATDGAGNSSEQAVSLNINNLDEEAPTITSAATATAIDENSGAGQVVYTVTSDDTADISGGVTYSLKGTGDNSLFSIDGGTGDVTLTGNPDYENKSSYSFTVVATDGAGNSSEQAVSLAINDVAGAFSISATDAVLSEGDSGDTTFTFTVSRTGDTSGATTVDYAVTGYGAHPATADDFGGTLPGGTVSFADGQTSAGITFNASGDTTYEQDEEFAVTLSNPGNGEDVSSGGEATGTILNDETGLSITATDAVKAEGDTGSSPYTSYTFTVTRSGDVSGATTVDWEVQNLGVGTLDLEDFNYITPTGTVTFLSGETTKTITVDVYGDTAAENDETFHVALFNASADVDEILSPSAEGTISNDDTTISMDLLNPAEYEGDSGTTPIVFSVTRTGDLSQTNTVDWTVGHTDTDAADFGGTTPSGTLTFSPSVTTQNITVEVSGDTEFESAEAFSVELSNPTGGASIGVSTVSGTITNDDTNFEITALDADKYEGDSGPTEFTFTVTRDGYTGDATSVDWAVTPSGLDPADASDFGGTLPSGTVSFSSSQTSKTISISVEGDTDWEEYEEFTVTLSNPANGETLTTPSDVGTIWNDDPNIAELGVGDSVPIGFFDANEQIVRLSDPDITGLDLTGFGAEDKLQLHHLNFAISSPATYGANWIFTSYPTTYIRAMGTGLYPTVSTTLANAVVYQGSSIFWARPTTTTTTVLNMNTYTGIANNLYLGLTAGNFGFYTMTG